MNTAKSYPVFEADQVLTNRHLNDMFNYLEQHDRLTRIKLIGSGIVCGLDVSFQEKDSISVSKGCGLTSQGYLITFCDTKFTHFIPYTTRNFPDDLLFIKQCEDDINYPKPFYKEAFKDGIFELLTAAQFADLKAGDKLNAVAFPDNSKVDLKKYAVVLFLETEEENLKNCDTNDCNDKGSRMDFEVRALLVEKALINELEKKQEKPVPAGKPTVKPDLHHVELRRYNVPVQNLKSADEVLQAFAVLTDDAKLRSISEVLNYCYIHYYYLLDDEPSNPFEDVFEQFKKLRDEILKNNPILIQYFYDFIDDVLKAYYEFKCKVFEVSTSCCGDEMNFPLHLMLGGATENTEALVRSSYREYFIYSPLFNDQKDKLAEVRLLFARIRLLISNVDFTSIRNFENRLVKITPSRYGYVDLSDRCIPYNYDVVDLGNELYRYWSYEKTRRGNYRFNLGYNANQYCFADNVVHPLLYDIERFDFFRIEGHIGKNVTNAITLVKTLQQENNLPFDIAALSADYIGALVRGEEPKCVIQDLESNYRMIIAELICKVHDSFCFAAKLPFVLPDRIINFTAANFARASAEDATTIKSTLAFNPNLTEKISHPFTSSLVSEFQAIKQYAKGDTLLKLCNPGANTIGAAYIKMAGKFANPVSVNTDLPVTSIQFHAFEFIDAIESILELVMNNELADINTAELKSRNERLEKEVSVISAFAILFLQKLESNDQSSLSDLASDLYLDLLVFNLQTILNLCFVEQVEALKSEYNRRMAQYRLAKNFSFYFKNHGGIEHKAGVPRGGTFILVYHEERRNRFIDRNALFVNKDLGNLMVSRFRDLIQTDVPLDTLTYQTKLLQTSILYKDPELYVRFKDVLSKYLDECKDLPEDKRKEITEILDREPKPKQFELTNGMVIADFYIPYMCCSDCPPIAYILPEKQEEPVETPTIKIDKNSFCSNDSTIFPITVTPQGGVVTGSGVSVQNGNNYFFSPANAAIGLHTLSYTANGKTANVQVEVIQAPVAKFSYVVTVNGATSILTLTNETAGRTTQTTYEWFRDGKSFSKEENPAPFEFKTAGPVKSITLNVTNGICQGNQKQEIVMPSEDPTIKIDKDSFCNNDKTEFPIIVTPPGGKVSGDGVNNRADGTSVFVPAEVKTPGLVILTYTVNGKSATTTVEVSETPFANFSIETKTEGGEMTVGFKNESRGISDKTRYEWFIDGKQFSEKRDPDPIIFKTATLPHIILLRETNGQCPSEFSLVINSEIEERTVSVCSNQKRFGIEPNLTPNDVVKVLDSGGLKLKETTLEFSPASTAVSQTTAFKVSYTINGRQVNVTITLIVVDADFLMKLTRNTSPVANFPTLLTLTAKETDALKYNWEITVANGRVLNFTTREVIFNYQQNDVFPGSLVTIRLTVTKTDQTGITCENSAQFVLTDSIFNKHMNAGDFDNHTTA
jgi:hypothetical protein